VAEIDRAGKSAAGDAGQKIQRAMDNDGTCNASKSAGTTRDGLRFGKDQVRELQPQHFSRGAGTDLITVGRRPEDGALNGEMSEWSIEHAWKLIPLARADEHRYPPTHS
jgi:hypothetical protein